MPVRFVSGSGTGWATADGAAVNNYAHYAVASAKGLVQAGRFQFSRDKKMVALYASSNSSNDDKVKFIVSGSSPWSTGTEWDGNVADIDLLHIGNKDDIGHYRVFVGSQGVSYIYNLRVDPSEPSLERMENLVLLIGTNHQTL